MAKAKRLTATRGAGGLRRDRRPKESSSAFYQTNECTHCGASASFPKQAVCDHRCRGKTYCDQTPTASTLIDVFANPCAYDSTNQSFLLAEKKEIKDSNSRILSIMSSSTIGSGSNHSTESEASDSDKEGHDELLRHNKSPCHDNSTTNRDSCSVDSRPQPPPSCDLIVAVGKENFFYSSGIFKYTSDYLNSESVELDPKGRFYLHFPYHSPNEWRPFAGFLQSYLVGRAKLSWAVFPTVLPWFLEFDMEELLQAADKFLLGEAVPCQLQKRKSRTAVVYVLGEPIPCQLGKRSETEEDHNDSVSVLLLLADVSFSAGLKNAKSGTRLLLKAKILDPQGSFHGIDDDDDHEPISDNGNNISLQWSLQDLQLLSELLLKFEDLREYLWESSLIRYLPQDLSVSDSSALLSNPLFPYLLREGMWQTVVESRKDEGAVDDMSKWSSKSTSTAWASMWSDTTLPTMNHDDKIIRRTKQEQDVLKTHLHRTLHNLERFQKLQWKNKVNCNSHLDQQCQSGASLPPQPQETDVVSQPSNGCTSNSDGQQGAMMWVSHEREDDASASRTYIDFHSIPEATRKFEC